MHSTPKHRGDVSSRRSVNTLTSKGGLQVNSLANAAGHDIEEMTSSTKAVWQDWALRIASPILEGVAENRLLRFKAFAEDSPCAEVATLEAFARTLCGIAPWCESEGVGVGADIPTQSAIAALETYFSDSKALEALFAGRDSRQPLVEAAFLAQALLRAPTSLAQSLSSSARDNLVHCLRSSRRIKPPFNNWILFSAIVECALREMECEDWDCVRVDYALRQLDQWYVGDGFYCDGPHFAFDYYNSFVIHPMLVDITRLLPNDPFSPPHHQPVLQRASRMAAHLESMISPEGTFPPAGRSLAYRFGILHGLAQAVLLDLLPPSLDLGAVRCAMTSVLSRFFSADGLFDSQGILTVGFVGNQPDAGESYISPGSTYLCSTAFLPLGLPDAHPFWSYSNAPWTSKSAWEGALPRRVAMPQEHASTLSASTAPATKRTLLQRNADPLPPPERVTAAPEFNDQLLYFTSTSLAADDSRLVFISDQSGHPNLWDMELQSGKRRQLTFNSEGALKSYVYFDGIPYRGFGKASVSFHALSGTLYYIQGREIRKVGPDGNESTLAEYPEGQMTAFTHVSADGRFLCVPTTDEYALDGTHPLAGRPDYDIDKRVRDAGLSSFLRVYDTASGAEVLCENVPRCWITHVQFSPRDPSLILYNHEWSADCGIRRIWIFNGKTHRRLRSENKTRSRADNTTHEMWERDGTAIIYHGHSADSGEPFIGRASPDGAFIQEIPLGTGCRRYGHFTAGNPNVLVSDGYYEEEDDPKRMGGNFISRLDVDWDKDEVLWTPLCQNLSSWSSQDAHPHPIIDHHSRFVYFNSDFEGKRAIYRVPLL